MKCNGYFTLQKIIDITRECGTLTRNAWGIMVDQLKVLKQAGVVHIHMNDEESN